MQSAVISKEALPLRSNFKRGLATAHGDLYHQLLQMIECFLVFRVTAAVPFVGLPSAHAHAVGAAGLRLPGQPQTGAVLLVSNLNEQVRNRVAIATESSQKSRRADLEWILVKSSI